MCQLALTRVSLVQLRRVHSARLVFIREHLSGPSPAKRPAGRLGEAMHLQECSGVQLVEQTVACASHVLGRDVETPHHVGSLCFTHPKGRAHHNSSLGGQALFVGYAL